MACLSWRVERWVPRRLYLWVKVANQRASHPQRSNLIEGGTSARRSMTRAASGSIGSTRTGVSMLRRGDPVALLELACEVSLRGETTAQGDVSDGAGGMAKIRELPVRQCKAFLPDPLRDAAFVLFEHSVQIAQRHCHVVRDGLAKG